MRHFEGECLSLQLTYPLATFAVNLPNFFVLLVTVKANAEVDMRSLLLLPNER